MKRCVLPFLVCAAVLGCASSTSVLRPEDGATVMLEMEESTNVVRGEGFVAIHLDDFDCFGFSVSGGTKSTAMPTLKVVPVSGRRFLTVATSYHAFSGGVVKSCSPIYTFPVRRGSRYRLVIGNDDKYCSANVEEVGADKLELVKRESSTPLGDGNGPWCKADPRFQGSSAYQTPRSSGI